MPLSIEERLTFLEAHFLCDGVTPFERADWFAKELYTPLAGFRLVPRDPKRLCDECKVRSGSIVEAFTWALADELEEHASTEVDECGGLLHTAVIWTIMSIGRQKGKSTAVMGLIASILVSEPHKQIVFLASGEEQAERIVEDKLKKAIRASPVLTEYLIPVGKEIRCESTGSFLRTINASFHGGTGGSYDYLFVDEAVGVTPRMLAAITPTILRRGGAYCPIHPEVQHGKSIGGKPPRCPYCNDRLIPWFPRICIFSSQDIITGTEQDWFIELLQVLEEHPELRTAVHKFSDDQSVKLQEKDGVRKSFEFLYHVPSLAPYFEVQLSNRAKRMGETFLHRREIEACIDPSLSATAESSEEPCVSWLDCSYSRELTSWIVLEDAHLEGEKPWETVRLVRADIWDPASFGGPLEPGGVINPAAIQRVWDQFLPLFLDLRLTIVDTRGMPWAKDFAIWNQKHSPYGKKVKLIHRKDEDGTPSGLTEEGLSGQKLDRRKAYLELERRVAFKKIVFPGGPVGDRIKAELLGAVRVPNQDGTFDVRDRNRKKMHLDVADAVAGGCLLAYREMTRRQRSIGFGGGGDDGPDRPPSALELNKQLGEIFGTSQTRFMPGGY